MARWDWIDYDIETEDELEEEQAEDLENDEEEEEVEDIEEEESFLVPDGYLSEDEASNKSIRSIIIKQIYVLRTVEKKRGC